MSHAISLLNFLVKCALAALLVCAVAILTVSATQQEAQGFPFSALLGQTESILGIIGVNISDAQRILNKWDNTLKLGTWPLNSTLPWRGRGFPLMVMLNHMSGLKTIPVNILPINLDYYEFILGIPVKTPSGGIAITCPKLYLNSIAAVAGGRIYYGLPKDYENVKMDQKHGTFSVSTVLGGSSILEASFQPYAQAQPKSYSAFKSLIPFYKSVFSSTSTQIQPILEPLYSNSKHYCMNFPMDWTNSSTQYWTTAFDVTFNHNDLPLGTFGTKPLSAASPQGSFAVKTSWRLSQPWNFCK